MLCRIGGAAGVLLMAGLSGSAEAQKHEPITPTGCMALEEAVGSAITANRTLARSTETLHRSMSGMAPTMERRARLHESNQAVIAAAQELLGSTRKITFAMEDFQARLRECGRG